MVAFESAEETGPAACVAVRFIGSIVRLRAIGLVGLARLLDLRLFDRLFGFVIRFLESRLMRRVRCLERRLDFILFNVQSLALLVPTEHLDLLHLRQHHASMQSDPRHEKHVVWKACRLHETTRQSFPCKNWRFVDWSRV